MVNNSISAKLVRWYGSYQQLAARHRKVSLGLGFGILAILVALLFFDNVSLTPDVMLLVLFIAAVALGQALLFLRDWLPFIGILLVYESLHGFADNLGQIAHVTDIISVEKLIFAGTVPTIWLQQHLWHGQAQWYDIAATTLYFMHFVLPLVCAFWLWTKRKAEYWQFVTSLIVLCFAGFVTYILFPATPPWLASQEGFLPPVTKIIDQVLNLFPTHMTISTLYHHLNPNPVAAMPSLHAAFPWLVFLMLWQVKKTKALWFLPYCFALWFSIVYLGEHYVIDAVAGIVYATAVFALVQWVFVTRHWVRLSPLAAEPTEASPVLTEEPLPAVPE